MDANMGKRLTELREKLNLSQEELGQKIGVSRFSISNYESGKRNLTERVIKDICRECNIDYYWFTTGEGDMFHHASDELVDKINDLLEGQNETVRLVFRAFASFTEQDWLTVQKFIDLIKKNGADS